ncbi:MAG: nitrate ABC transporter permease [Gallionellaceae bacterium]|nr:nitrate ABC transporter permease [Gallionellaceae bacterium]
MALPAGNSAGVNQLRQPVASRAAAHEANSPKIDTGSAKPNSGQRAGKLLNGAFSTVMPPVLGLLLLVVVWAFVAQTTEYLPSPAKTWLSALEIFGDPFYDRGLNDKGIGWQLWASLKRVFEGFGLAALIGIPLGFMVGRFDALQRMMNPVISLLRPVSPLAWLPIGLAVFKAADPSAIFVIFITSIWPMVINTSLGVASVPQDYLNVARVLKLSEWKVFTKILLPASLPYVVTGIKLALGIAWLVIVAAEMLTGGVGIGFWIWDEWNNLNMAHIIVAIFVVGTVGLILEQSMAWVANRFDYRKN